MSESDRLSYAKVGVDIDATDAAKQEMAQSINRGDARVLNRLGAFASLVEGHFNGYRHPVLALKTDEPGSKQKLAFELGKVTSLCYDLIHHLINDVIVMGAEPLYVQDCIVCGHLDSKIVSTLVLGMAAACQAQGCVLVGGETSVQPGVVVEGVYVLSASAVGVVEKEYIIDGARITEDDVVLAVASNGLHTNGYTLVRKLLELHCDLRDQSIEEESFIDVIMRPHTCYYHAVRDLFRSPGLRGLAHITGGGIQDNLNRILPSSLDAGIELSCLDVPVVFKVIRDTGHVSDADMLRTFNMGVGLTLVCAPEMVDAFSKHLADHDCCSYPIGRIVKGSKRVTYSGAISW